MAFENVLEENGYPVAENNWIRTFIIVAFRWRKTEYLVREHRLFALPEMSCQALRIHRRGVDDLARLQRKGGF